jgi:hypothetical protein
LSNSGGNTDLSRLFAHRIAVGHEIDIRTIEAGEQQIVDGPVKILARAKHARDLVNFDFFLALHSFHCSAAFLRTAVRALWPSGDGH